MSFGLNKPSDPAAPYTVRANVARRATANPAFKPEFARSLRMHPVVAAVVAGIVFAVILGYALHARPTYETESLIYVEPAAIKALAADAGTFDATKYDSYIQQQILTAGRLDIVLAALQTLPRATWSAFGPTLQAAANRLQGDLKIQRAGTSYQLSFTLRGTDPVKTADTLNAIVKTYLSTGRKDELAQSDVRTQILLEERTRIQNELEADKAEAAQLSSALGMANPGLDAGNAYDEQLTGLRTQLAAARENHEIAAAQLAAVSGQDAAHLSGLTAAADEQLNADPALSAMKSSIGQRRATLAGAMAGLTPENPIYKQDQEELNDLDRQLASATQTARELASRRLQDKLRTDLSRTGDIESRVNSQLAQQTATATSASPRLQRASELNADIKRLMTRYASVDDSLRSLQLDASGPGLARLALAATPPPLPLASRIRLLLLAALPLALLCGLFAAVFARKRDHHVYTGPDLEQVLGFTPIAVLPAPADVAPGILREYILRLAAGVEGAYRGGNARTFVVTAAGASTDIPALTRALEDRLEALGLDAASVTTTQIFDPAYTPAGGATAGTALQPQRDASGRNEGFAAARLDLLKAAHDLIFIQAPAILTSAETEYVVRLADATILVAESGVTTRGDLLQAALLLERLNARGIGAVLDNLELRNADPAYSKAIRLLERRQASEPTPNPGTQETPRPAARIPTDDAEAAASPQAQPPAAPGPKVESMGFHHESTFNNEAAFVPAAPGQPTLHVTPVEAVPQPPAANADLQPTAIIDPQTGTAELNAEVNPAPEGGSPGLPLHDVDSQKDGVFTAAPHQSLAIPSFSQPEARNWLSRLLHRDDESVVSIIPAQGHEEPEQPIQSTQATHPLDIRPTEFTPTQPATLAEVVEFTLPEAVQTAPEVEQIEQLTHPEPVSPEPVWAKPVHPEPVSPEPPALPEPARAEAPVLAEPEPVPHLDPIPEEVLFIPQTASPAPLQEVAQTFPEAPAAEPVNPETSLSFRTARMEVEPARRNSGPWRDRRVAGSDAHILPSQDRRFNWAARTAQTAARANPPAPEPAAVDLPAPAPRPHLVPREANLTRNWGLLSRYQNAPEAQEGPEDDARKVRHG